MKNKEIEEHLNQIANYLKMDDVEYKPFAYQKASSSISALTEEVENLYEKKGREAIENIEGVGKNIADRIEELILTGETDYLKKLKEKFPISLKDLSRVNGLGPKGIKKLYDELGIKNLKDLKKEAGKGKISSVEGFGKKTEKNILEAIEFLEKDEGKWSLGEVLPIAEEIFNNLEKIKEVKRISFAGSLRRKKEIVGDVDVLISASETDKIMDRFTSFENIEKILGKGETKASIRLKEGFDVDLRVVEASSFGSALQYFTGSKNHNIRTRKIAISKGLKLNEYGLFKKGKKIAGRKEEEIYSTLGMNFIPPEIREDKGEIEIAVEEEFNLCKLSDIKGDLHVHTKWTGGNQTIEEMALVADGLGHDYLGIADHTKYLRVENGLNEKELKEQRKEIDKINAKFKKEKRKIKILQGCEANILENGSLDISETALNKLDYVIAGIHSHFKLSRTKMTERLVQAIQNPKVNIISHPTGRIIKRREPLDLDMEKIIEVAKKESVILEINSSPLRLDLSDSYIRKCVENNQPLIINSDSHDKNQLKNIKFGVNQARRGWAGKENIVNTKNLNDLLKILER